MSEILGCNAGVLPSPKILAGEFASSRKEKRMIEYENLLRSSAALDCGSLLPLFSGSLRRLGTHPAIKAKLLIRFPVTSYRWRPVGTKHR
ncbi:MAG: hypothetical protein JNL67_23255 [Planctomycetaceae bacterium]|nr:hypothetical protein [Planctomycetaceae bacterium]